MKILYYEWNECSADDVVDALRYMGHEVIRCNILGENYEYDTSVVKKIEKLVEEYSCEVLFSLDYFPLVAKAAQSLQISYLSWVYDSPHWTLYSPTTWSEYVYIFVFDYQQYQMLRQRGIPHAYHLPLAVHTRRLKEQLGLPVRKSCYQSEVSFVGSLYETNLFDQICYLPENVRGYLDGIMNVQKMVFGTDILSDLLTNELLDKLQMYVKLEMDEIYAIDRNTLFANMLHMKLTSMERIEYLDILGDVCKVQLYSGSARTLVPKVAHMGTISYRKKMPEIFRDSKINLNITLRSIKSGMTLRALDIMGAGGFLLSNYQPELAEYFKNGEELVMYESREHLVELVKYYLEQESRREEIARNGWEKIQKEFSYEIQIGRLFEMWMCERRKE